MRRKKRWYPICSTLLVLSREELRKPAQDDDGGPMIVAPQHSLQEHIRRLEMLFTLTSTYYGLVTKFKVWKVTHNFDAHSSSDF